MSRKVRISRKGKSSRPFFLIIKATILINEVGKNGDLQNIFEQLPPPPLKKTQKNMTKPLVFPGQKWYYHIAEIIKHHVTVDQGG